MASRREYHREARAVRFQRSDEEARRSRRRERNLSRIQWEAEGHVRDPSRGEGEPFRSRSQARDPSREEGQRRGGRGRYDDRDSSRRNIDCDRIRFHGSLSGMQMKPARRRRAVADIFSRRDASRTPSRSPQRSLSPIRSRYARSGRSSSPGRRSPAYSRSPDRRGPAYSRSPDRRGRDSSPPRRRISSRSPSHERRVRRTDSHEFNSMRASGEKSGELGRFIHHRRSPRHRREGSQQQSMSISQIAELVTYYSDDESSAEDNRGDHSEDDTDYLRIDVGKNMRWPEVRNELNSPARNTQRPSVNDVFGGQNQIQDSRDLKYSGNQEWRRNRRLNLSRDSTRSRRAIRSVF